MKLLKLNGIIVIAFLFLLVFCDFGHCGLVLTEVDGDQSIISEGRIKSLSSDPNEGQIIVDLKKGVITALNHQKKIVSIGTIDEYCTLAKKMIDCVLQTAEMAKAQGIEDMPSARSAQPIVVSVKKIGDGGLIAGCSTIKYEVYADGKLYEEAWISMDQKLTREIGDMEQLARFEECASQVIGYQVMGYNTVEATAEYQELIKSGWVLKSIDYECGDAKTVVEVNKIEEKKISDREFEVPAGYEIVPFSNSFLKE